MGSRSNSTLTKAVVDEALREAKETKKPVPRFDSKLSGFGVIARPSGVATFIIR